MIPPLKGHLHSPKIRIFDEGVEPHLDQNDLNLTIQETAVALILASNLREQITANAYLMTFDSRDLQAMLVMHGLSVINAEEALTSIWLKTRNFLNINLEKSGDADTLTDEKHYQLHAVATMWAKVFMNYSTHTPEECEGMHFYTIFTNRQAQILLQLI